MPYRHCGSQVLKAGLGRITEDTPQYQVRGAAQCAAEHQSSGAATKLARCGLDVRTTRADRNCRCERSGWPELPQRITHSSPFPCAILLRSNSCVAWALE
eukprot:4148803-Pleurochrysis_carterae.AAC.1